MIDTSFLHQLDKFNLVINRKVNSNYIGERESNAVGRGLIYKDHAAYTPGDDFRTIDWRVFARTDKLYVKRYEEERNLQVHIFVDYSGSMNFGTNFKKAEFAAMIGLGYAYLSLKNNEKFVLSTFGESLERYRPKRGRQQLAAMVDYLNKKTPEGKTDIDTSLGQYRKTLRFRSLIIIISDFLYPIESLRNTLYQFKDHEIKLIQVLDKVEKKLNLEGDFRLKDLESNAVMRTFISPYLKKRYGEQLEEHNKEIARLSEEIGAKFYSVSTDMTIFDAMFMTLVAKPIRM
ncbi:DUF58 domain-containing protein [Candidatus Woesearchaeota archaeon]|nr:DUF58 domain-containing protein [Candidatus Woesearchaeota archaeon]